MIWIVVVSFLVIWFLGWGAKPIEDIRDFRRRK